MHALVVGRSMAATAAAMTERAASSTDSRGPPRVRTERLWSGSRVDIEQDGPGRPGDRGVDIPAPGPH